jgi:uncharacterized membrane protein
MTQADQGAPAGSRRNDDRRGWMFTVGSFAAVALILGLTPGAVNFSAWPRIEPHIDFTPLALSPLLVQLHVATVMTALAGGAVQFATPKGTTAHKVLGWIWVLAMFSTAVISLFIRELNHGAFSPIHLFSLMTIIGAPMAVWLARTGRIASHRRAMRGLYVGLVIAGVIAIAPGRLAWAMFFG